MIATASVVALAVGVGVGGVARLAAARRAAARGDPRLVAVRPASASPRPSAWRPGGSACTGTAASRLVHDRLDRCRRRQAGPVGEVEARAPSVDVALHEPRERRDVGRPPPLGLVAVAVVARLLGDRLGLRVGPLEGVGGRRVGVAAAPVRDELDEDEQRRRRCRSPRAGSSSRSASGARRCWPCVVLPFGCDRGRILLQERAAPRRGGPVWPRTASAWRGLWPARASRVR